MSVQSDPGTQLISVWLLITACIIVEGISLCAQVMDGHVFLQGELAERKH